MSRIALLAVGLLLLVPAAASAQTPATLTASGVGEADVSPADRNDEASIRAAVEAANAKALPLAIADARTRAAALATAAGVTLGPLVAISDSGQPNYGPFYLSRGTFGNGRFCGQVRNTRVVVRDGRRRRVRAPGTHRVCRVPPENLRDGLNHVRDHLRRPVNSMPWRSARATTAAGSGASSSAAARTKPSISAPGE